VVSSPLTTPEQAAQFLAVMKEKSKRHSLDPSQHTPTRPAAFLLADGGVDSWFMQQKYRDKELRRRRQEAAQLLHGYKGYYPEKESDIDFGHWSPRNSLTPKNRSSFGEGRSDKKSENDKYRRQTSFARLETNDFDKEEDSRDDFLPNPLAPDRTEFLNDHHLYDGTKYPKPADGNAYSEGHTLFNENGAGENEEREAGVTYTPFRHMNVDISDVREDSAEGEQREEAAAAEFSEREDSIDRESLQSRRQRHYDALFQPGHKVAMANVRGASVKDIVEGKVRQRIDEEDKRIQDSESKLAERLEKRFAENDNESHAVGPSVSLSIKTEGSPPQLPETVWRDFISDGKF
jgi:hypothetical protein